MALSVTVSPPQESTISTSADITADVVGADTWIAAVYDGSKVELVHDGSVFMPRFVASAVSAITGGIRYVVRKVGGWPGRRLTLRYYEMGGGGSAAMSAPIVDKESNSNNSGNEVVALQLPFDTDLCAALMSVKLAIVGGSAAGTATFRAYIGGSQATVDASYTGGGTLVGTRTTSAALALLRLTGSPVANPGGATYVTLTYQSSGPGVDVTKLGVTGVVE